MRRALAPALVAAALTALVVAAPSSGAPRPGGCPTGKERLTINGARGACIRLAWFAGTAGPQTLGRAVDAAFGRGLDALVPGAPAIDALLGVAAPDAIRWRREVVAAGVAVLQAADDERVLLAIGPTAGDIPITDLTRQVGEPSGLSEAAQATVRGVIDPLEDLRRRATGSIDGDASGTAGRYTLQASPAWEFEACPDPRGFFTVDRKLTLTHRFAPPDGAPTITGQTVHRAHIVARVGENSRLVSFAFELTTTSTDSRGVTWRASEIGGDVRDPAGNWTQIGGDQLNVTAERDGRRIEAPSAELERLVNGLSADAVKLLVKLARKDLERAFGRYYTDHACNEIVFRPATLDLQPGDTGTVEATMKNVSPKPGNPKWKPQRITGTGVQVISSKPSRGGKGVIITIKRPRRSGQADGPIGLTVDGVSRRGRGLDTVRGAGGPIDLRVTAASGSFSYTSTERYGQPPGLGDCVVDGQESYTVALRAPNPAFEGDGEGQVVAGVGGFVRVPTSDTGTIRWTRANCLAAGPSGDDETCTVAIRTDEFWALNLTVVHRPGAATAEVGVETLLGLSGFESHIAFTACARYMGAAFDPKAILKGTVPWSAFEGTEPFVVSLSDAPVTVVDQPAYPSVSITRPGSRQLSVTLDPVG